MILVDTSVWSLALRRRSEHLNPDEAKAVESLTAYVSQGLVKVIGPIRQELLSGVRDSGQFESLRQRLRDFPDEPLLTADFEEAALLSNRLRAQGIASTGTDCLITAVASSRKWAVFTTDHDFERYQAASGVELIGLS